MDLARGRRTALAVAAGGALCLALWLEVGVQGRDAFWLDEAWTGAIVGQRSWGDFFHQVYWDVNAPFYYLVMHLWAGVFGLSDAALRAPSLIFATAAPLVLALTPVEGLPREDRLAWAAVVALWFPGLCFAEEARGYALLLCVSAGQAVAFLRLLHTPSTRRAGLWAALAALAILIHYDAAIAGGLQGLVYLALHRLRAAKTWPAALAFAPAFGWLGFHWPRIAEFTRPDIAWYSPLKPAELWPVAGYIAGCQVQLWGLMYVAGIALALRFAWAPRARPPRPDRYVWLAALAAALGAGILIAMGFFRPSFTFRYLTPFAPGILLGVVQATRLLAGRRVGAAFLVLIVAYGGISGWMLTSRYRMAPRRYTFEGASAVLGRTHPQRLVFLWDHPVDPVLHPEQLSALGGFFLHRDGQPVAVDPVILRRGEDPNTRLLAEASAPGSAILWLYDTVVQGTAAVRVPPQIARRNPAWRCRQFGYRRFGVLGCTREASGPR